MYSLWIFRNFNSCFEIKDDSQDKLGKILELLSSVAEASDFREWEIETTIVGENLKAESVVIARGKFAL